MSRLIIVVTTCLAAAILSSGSDTLSVAGPGSSHLRSQGPAFSMAVGGPVAPDGKTEVTCDLPASELKRNVGGSDGAGLCVFTSCEFAARFQGIYQLKDFQAYMRHYPGGGYPEKLAKYIDKICKEHGWPVPEYLQAENGDPEILKAALRSGRMPCVVYDGHDPRYSGRIAHMLNLVHLDDKYACIRDNNFIGERELLWMNPAEFYQRWKGDGGWCVIFLAPPPPPPPHN